MAKICLNFAIYFLLTVARNKVNCDGSKLILQISPSLLDNPSFCYHVLVRCLVNQSGTVGDYLRYSSILRNIDAHTFINAQMKSVEQIIFNFQLLICTDFIITVKALKWHVVVNESTGIQIELDNNLSKPLLIYNDKVKADEQTHEADLLLDLGKHFILNLSPVIKGTAFYDVEILCHENSEQLYYAKTKCANNECAQIIFFREKQCEFSEYDINVWMWNSLKEKERMSDRQKDRCLTNSKILIVDGQELNIHYHL